MAATRKRTPIVVKPSARVLSSTGATGPTGPDIEESQVTSTHGILRERDVGSYRVPPHELRRIKAAVQAINEKPQDLNDWSTGMFFLGPTLVVAWLLWGPAFDEMSAAGQTRYVWVGPILLAAGIVSFALGYALRKMYQGIDDVRVVRREHVVDLIENVEERFMSPGANGDGSG